MHLFIPGLPQGSAVLRRPLRHKLWVLGHHFCGGRAEGSSPYKGDQCCSPVTPLILELVPVTASSHLLLRAFSRPLHVRNLTATELPSHCHFTGPHAESLPPRAGSLLFHFLPPNCPHTPSHLSHCPSRCITALSLPAP